MHVREASHVWCKGQCSPSGMAWAAQRKGPKFGALMSTTFLSQKKRHADTDRHTGRRQSAPAQLPRQPRQSAGRAALADCRRTSPRYVNCSFRPLVLNPHPSQFTTTNTVASLIGQSSHTNAESQIPPSSSPSRRSLVFVCLPSPVSRLPPVLPTSLWRACLPLIHPGFLIVVLRCCNVPRAHLSRHHLLFPHPSVMALGAYSPLQSSAKQDLSLFGARPVDLTAHSSDPCLTNAAVGIRMTLQETLTISFSLLILIRAWINLTMSNVIMAPGSPRDSLRPDQSFW